MSEDSTRQGVNEGKDSKGKGSGINPPQSKGRKDEKDSPDNDFSGNTGPFDKIHGSDVKTTDHT